MDMFRRKHCAREGAVALKVHDLPIKWRLLRGRAVWSNGVTAVTIETQAQLAEALKWNAEALNRCLKESYELPDKCVEPMLALFGLSASELGAMGKSPSEILCLPLPTFSREVEELGGTLYQLPNWERLVAACSGIVSDGLNRGRGRLFLHALRPEAVPDAEFFSQAVSPRRALMLGPGKLDRLLEPGNSDYRSDPVPEFPSVQFGDRAMIEFNPASGFASERCLRSRPLSALLFQDYKLKGDRCVKLLREFKAITTSQPMLIPEGVELEPRKMFIVPGKDWGNFRKLIAVITERAIDPSAVVPGLKAFEIDVDIREGGLNALAMALQRESTSGAASYDGARERPYGDFRVWQFEYTVVDPTIGVVA
jgi:hypothetical protein